MLETYDITKRGADYLNELVSRSKNLSKDEYITLKLLQIIRDSFNVSDIETIKKLGTKYSTHIDDDLDFLEEREYITSTNIENLPENREAMEGKYRLTKKGNVLLGGKNIFSENLSDRDFVLARINDSYDDIISIASFALDKGIKLDRIKGIIKQLKEDGAIVGVEDNDYWSDRGTMRRIKRIVELGSRLDEE